MCFGASRPCRGALCFCAKLVCEKLFLASPGEAVTTFSLPACLTARSGTRNHVTVWEASWEDVMQLHKHLLMSIFGKTVVATAVLSGLLLFAGAPSAKANDWDDCNRRAAYAEFRLHQSIEYFGYYSPQAAYWRHERHEAYEELERYRRREWREREWREHEWREHPPAYHGPRHYRDKERHVDRDREP